MKNSTLLLTSITLFSTLAIAACAPGPRGNQGQERLSPDEVFSQADKNGDGQLSKEEFISSLPQHR